MRVVTAGQMRLVEEESLKYDMTYQRLMENAGSAASAFIKRTFKVEGINCMIFCGSGNNGGDGFVAARKLIESGANVLVATVGDKPESDQARAMRETVELMGMPVLSIEEDYERVSGILEKADIVVDAIYGTGFRGELGTWAEKACEAINNAIAAVIALDIPSGVECDTGRAAENAVKADFTIAFDSRKPMHILPSSMEYCGVVEVVDIGIPEKAHDGIDSLYGGIKTETVIKSLPKRGEASHKGNYGKLLIIAGCGRYRGAAALATHAALRCGVGLVTLASTKPVLAVASAKLFECMYLELPESETGTISAVTSIPLLRESVSQATAILFGCGVGAGDDAEELLKFLVGFAKCPLVIDADGINALSANIDILNEAEAPVILTPHTGEMSRLSGLSIAEIEEDRHMAAASFTENHGVYLVLKGPGTVISSPEGKLLINGTGNAGLAKGGSGDVLAGMISAFLAQGLNTVQAIAAGVHLHGLAADNAAAELSQYSMLPSDLPLYLAKILNEYGL